MNEIALALSKYAGISVKHFEDDPGYIYLAGNLDKIIPFERPDGYLVADDTVYIIEHFEFDSSEVLKGSTSRIELGRTEREFQKYPVGSQTPFSDELNITQSINNYIDNATRNIRNHYKNIQKYKENLSDLEEIRNKPFKVGFFIEDKTVLGSHCKTDRGFQALSLVDCQQFLDEFENCTELDFCICANTFTSGDMFSLFGAAPRNTMRGQLYFLSKASIHKYRENQKSISDIDYISIPTRTIGVKIPF